MCFRLVISSNMPLALVEWNDASPAFNVEPLDQRMTTVREHFSYSHFFEMGAHTGCACGFMSEDDESREERMSREASLAALHRYLEMNLSSGAGLEILLFWEGSDYDLKGKAELALQAFEGNEFPLGENILTSIVSHSEARSGK